MRFVEARIERAAAMPGGAEGHALGGRFRVGALTVIGGDQARDIDQPIGRSRLARERIQARIHAAASAALLSAMLCMSSFQDLTKALAPSVWSLRPSSSTSNPAAA